MIRFKLRQIVPGEIAPVGPAVGCDDRWAPEAVWTKEITTRPGSLLVSLHELKYLNESRRDIALHHIP